MRDLQDPSALDFEADESLRLAKCRIVIDENRHEVPVHHLADRIPCRNEFPLIPIVNLDVSLKCVGVRERTDNSRPLTLLCFDYLTAVDNFSTSSALFVQVARVPIAPIKIG